MVERKSKQTAVEDRPELMSSPINKPAYPDPLFHNIIRVLSLFIERMEIIVSQNLKIQIGPEKYLGPIMTLLPNA